MSKRQTEQTKQPIYASIIVPTYKEGSNLESLTERLFTALAKEKLDQTTELIVVDDNSNDGSKETMDALSKKYNCRIIVRTKERGLSSAVLHGFSQAANTSEALICMDADLQHPPEKVPELIAALKQTEFVIGTRYAGGNSIDKDWPVHRRIISSGARLLARPLTPLSDPMTGFFGITKQAFSRAGDSINPIGFKICMETFVKSNIQKYYEVPIVFGVRTAGESKLDSKVIFNYLGHLYELYNYQLPWFLPMLVIIFINIALFGVNYVAKRLQ